MNLFTAEIAIADQASLSARAFRKSTLSDALVAIKPSIDKGSFRGTFEGASAITWRKIELRDGKVIGEGEGVGEYAPSLIDAIKSAKPLAWLLRTKANLFSTSVAERLELGGGPRDEISIAGGRDFKIVSIDVAFDANTPRPHDTAKRERDGTLSLIDWWGRRELGSAKMIEDAPPSDYVEVELNDADGEALSEYRTTRGAIPVVGASVTTGEGRFKILSAPVTSGHGFVATAEPVGTRTSRDIAQDIGLKQPATREEAAVERVGAEKVRAEYGL